VKPDRERVISRAHTEAGDLGRLGRGLTLMSAIALVDKQVLVICIVITPQVIYPRQASPLTASFIGAMDENRHLAMTILVAGTVCQGCPIERKIEPFARAPSAAPRWSIHNLDESERRLRGEGGVFRPPFCETMHADEL